MTTTKKAKFKCPDCVKVYNDAAHLGIHRAAAHGIPGTSVNAVKNRMRRKAAEEHQAAWPLEMDGVSRDDSPQRRPMSFTCPKCKLTSHHPEDERHGYCGNCHEFTRSPPGNLPNAGDTHIFVDGIVSGRNREPYVRLVVNGEKAQLSVAEAHKIALDLLKISARTEADAMVLSFFTHMDFPEGAAAAIMQEFRYFRQRQDEQLVAGMTVDPDSGETIR